MLESYFTQLQEGRYRNVSIYGLNLCAHQVFCFLSDKGYTQVSKNVIDTELFVEYLNVETGDKILHTVDFYFGANTLTRKVKSE